MDEKFITKWYLKNERWQTDRDSRSVTSFMNGWSVGLLHPDFLAIDNVEAVGRSIYASTLQIEDITCLVWLIIRHRSDACRSIIYGEPLLTVLPSRYAPPPCRRVASAPLSSSWSYTSVAPCSRYPHSAAALRLSSHPQMPSGFQTLLYP